LSFARVDVVVYYFVLTLRENDGYVIAKSQTKLFNNSMLL